MNWKTAQFMEQHLGEEYDALIISVQKFGFFVELMEIFVEGLVPINRLEEETGERCVYRERDHAIVSGRGGHTRVWRLGDRVRVLADRIDPIRRRVEFALGLLDPAFACAVDLRYLLYLLSIFSEVHSWRIALVLIAGRWFPRVWSLAYSDGLWSARTATRDCEVTTGGRSFAAWAGLAAGWLVWWLTRDSGGPLGAVLPELYAILAFGIVSPIVLVFTAGSRSLRRRRRSWMRLPRRAMARPMAAATTNLRS